MKANATLLVTLSVTMILAAMPLAAQDASENKPDYSKPTMLRLFANEEFDNEPVEDVRFYVGAVQFRALGTNWRFNYLPIMAPLPGTRFATTREWPDAFSLSRTGFATSHRVQQRMLRAERRRIEKITNPKATIKVKVD